MNNIKKLRKEKKLLQRDIAKICNVSISTYSYWENCIYEPDQENLIKLANFFDVSIDYLLGQTTTPGFSPDEQKLGYSETKKVTITPLEDDLLYEFRQLGKKKGLPFQKTVIAYIKQLQNIQ